MKVLVTGATGYIGGRLVPRLLAAGHEVRCMTRDPSQLTLDPWLAEVEVVTASVLDAGSLEDAVQGCDAAFYLVHSMQQHHEDFAEVDRAGAKNFAWAADRAGLQRIVYLGGLGVDDEELSPHLASRQEVGRILASGATPVTEIRAAVIIGSGSLSFEMVRHLTEILPVMMTPKWVRSRCQPIAIRNVLQILIASLTDPEPVDRLYEIGGPDVLTYEEMMHIYAEVAGLSKRLVIPLPIYSARLSPLMIGLLTPLPEVLARPLIESLVYDVVVTGEHPPGFPPESLFSYREALQLALARVTDDQVETRWSDSLTKPAIPLPGDPVWSGGKMFVDRQIADSIARPDDLFWAVTRIGGDVGYYSMDWAWALRGWFDSLIGGVGLRRGRRHPDELRPGEALDFFRVAEIDPENRRLTLRAEMKVPGAAWLGWWVEPTEEGSRLHQNAYFVPRGLLGRLYWYVLLPFHAPIWRRMTERMAQVAARRRHIRSGRRLAGG